MTHRYLQDKMVNTTPLSITYQLPKPKQKWKQKGSSFLEKDKRKTSRRAEPKYEFDGKYREPAAGVKKTSKRLPKHKKSNSDASAVSSIESAQTSPRKRLVEVLRYRKPSEKQALRTEDTSALSNGFDEKRPDQAFSIPSLPKNAIVNADTSINDMSDNGTPIDGTSNSSTSNNRTLVLIDPDSSSSKPFVSKCLEASSKAGFGSPSPKSYALSIKAISELEDLSRTYLRLGQENHADHVGDESEAETVLDAMDEPSHDDLLSNKAGFAGLEQDDHGLHDELQDLSIIGKKRRMSDRLDSSTSDKQSDNISGATLVHHGSIRMESSGLSTFQASSGSMGKNDEEEDIHDATKPCAKRTKMSVSQGT